MGQVGIYIPTGDDTPCVVAARRASVVRLAEDSDEVGDPFLVALSGEQRHHHQLNAQEHEQVAPFGLDAEHGDHSVSPTATEARRRRYAKSE